MYTISRLARQFNLSRSTLLYYDKIGLLCPSGRTPSNYRVYANNDRLRLEKICIYKQMGISLDTIQTMLDSKEASALTTALEKRLRELSREIETLRSQQDVIVGILKSHTISDHRDRLNKEKWTELLRAAGLDDAGMHQWHVEFETRHPLEHQQFLESLGIPGDEIEQIRKRSQRGEAAT